MSRPALLLFLVSALLTAVPALSQAAADDAVTFSEHVAPIFMNHCAACHRPNDVAPMSLLTYEEARPWAKSIRRAVSEREMPPWDADRDHGVFSNDTSLSDEQIETIVAWVAQGAVEGDPAKMPAVPALSPPGTWKMGEEPDYVVQLASVDVPADGPDVFVTQVFGMEVPEGKWVRAVELLPGNTDVLHHVVTYLGPFGMNPDEQSDSGETSVIFLNEAAKRKPGMAEAPRFGGVWVAGSPPSKFPQGTGKTLRPNQMLSFNMHYHPSGTAGSDASRVGFYFGEGELEKEITTAFAADPGLYIPAGAAEHSERAVYVFNQDSRLLSLLPHMHQRGKSMTYTLARPGMEDEIVLRVGEYDYNWQNIYELAEPLSAPAGSVLTVEATWDNSAENLANPDPGIDVPWGDGTNNEMLVAFFDYIVDEGKSPKPVPATKSIDQLLALHDPDEGYAIEIEGMGFGQVWGLVLPEEPGTPGNFYVTLNTLIISGSVKEIERQSDELLFTAEMITSAGGSRMPLGFIAHRTSTGIEGEMFFGRRVTAENVDELRGSGRSFAGTSYATKHAASSAPTAGGR